MRFIFSFLFLSFFVLTMCNILFADMYSYTDAQGTMHFVDDPSKIPAKERKKMHATRDSATGSSSAGSDVVIEFYSNDSCGPCRDAEEYLQSRGYRYIKYSTDESRESAKRFKKVGGGYVPFFVIGSYKSEGFNESTEWEIDKIMNHTPTARERIERREREERGVKRQAEEDKYNSEHDSH